MKHILALIIFTFAFFYGCGDTIVNNVNPTPEKEIIYSLDSLGAVTDSIGTNIDLFTIKVYSLDTLYNVGVSQIELTFTGHTNLDAPSMFYLYVSAEQNGANYWSKSMETNTAINKDYSLIIDVKGHSYLKLFSVILYSFQSGTKYVYFKNIKIYKK